METALRGHGLLFHLTDGPPALQQDQSNAADVKTWQTNDGKVMAAMVNSTKQSMIMSLSKCKTAKAIWSCLKACYVQDSGALLHTLMQQTHVIEQQDMSVDEYYSAFGRLMGSLTSMMPECTADDCPAHKFIEKFLIVLSWVSERNLIPYVLGCFMILPLEPRQRHYQNCSLKRHVSGL